ncbi:lipopolysaccharide biosynthesis protein [Rhizobium sullae]|uniref:O-antigen/teichoic acid export membrane protein n=1 Tax=Rhizobium sullae TaxID=50338 RepID=A0A4R3Q289_RHISU|nr:lipopolysaccharide biosynthesis protein [Rhizobium sullae]TCU15178.1 O-antigen/teichoic acid export membrane protein [Rhizobium sullae]
MSAFSLIAKKADRFRARVLSERDFAKHLRQILHLLSGNFAASMVGLVAFALTARALGPADYGILALCFAFSRAIERLVSFQSWQPLIKFGAQAMENQRTEDLRRLLKFGFVLDVGAALVSWIVAVGLILFASPLVGIRPEVQTFALIYCSALPFQIAGMPTAVLRLFGGFATLAYSQVLGSLVRVLLCGIGLLAGWGLREFTFIWMGMQIISSMSMTVLAFLETRRRGYQNILTAPLTGITQSVPGLWRFALSANISLTIRSSANELDTLLVGYLADPTAAGLYHIAKRIGRMAQQAGVQVQTVVYPELSRLWATHSVSAFRRIVRQTQWLLLAAGICLIAVVSLTIKPLLLWTAGPQFIGAAPLVVVQAIAVVMVLNGSVLRSALLAMGRENAVLRSVLFSTLAFHLTAFALIPVIGPMGANIAHITMASLWMLAMLLPYRAHIADNAGANDTSGLG